MSGAPVVTWRIILCDNTGRYISILDGIAQDVEAEFTLNRAAMLAFNVPSEHPYVSTVKGTDNLPYLSVGKRSVKAYRKVGTAAGGWSLVFAGRVWSLEDSGDEDTCRTQVTCYDPLKILEKRLVRTHLGEYWKASQWWADTDAVQIPPSDQLWHSGQGGGSKIIKNMIERSRKFGGMPPGGTSTGDEMSPVHISTGTFGVWPTAGWEETPPMTLTTDPGSYIMPYIIQICNTGTCDLVVEYRDAYDRGVFIQLGAKKRVGRPDLWKTVKLSYAKAPFSAVTFNRAQTMDDVANYIHLWGKKASGQKGIAEDTASQDEHTGYLVMEVAENLSDIMHEAFLQKLADMRLKLQKDPRDMVSVTPTPEGAPLPWTDYYLGDTIGVEASENTTHPVTRQTVSGAQRVYRIKIRVDNDIGEIVDELTVSPQDAE